MAQSDSSCTEDDRAREEPVTYAWRIRLFLPECTPLEHDEATLALGDQLGFTLKPARREEAIRDSRELVLTQGGYASEEEARECGVRAKTALMLSSARLRIGVDLGNDTAPSGLTDYGAQEVRRARGVRVLNDVHGLMVYPEVPPPKFTSGSVKLHAGRTAQQFAAAFDAGYAADIQLTERQRLALELYAASFFETSARARFLVLVTVIESLVETKPSTDRDCKCIDALVSTMEQTELDAKCSLLDRLGRLKGESVRQGTLWVVRQHVPNNVYEGQKADRFFDRCYRLRSDLLHQGKDEGIAEVLHSLNRLVADVLCAAAGTSPSQAWRSTPDAQQSAPEPS